MLAERVRRVFARIAPSREHGIDPSPHWYELPIQ
jgi:hypothetical protein